MIFLDMSYELLRSFHQLFRQEVLESEQIQHETRNKKVDSSATLLVKPCHSKWCESTWDIEPEDIAYLLRCFLHLEPFPQFRKVGIAACWER